MQQSIPAASSAPSPWKPDSPAEFPEAGQEPHLDAVQYQLATLGRPLARLHTHYALRDDATADLAACRTFEQFRVHVNMQRIGAAWRQ